MKNFYYIFILIFSIFAMYCADSETQNFQGRMNPEARAAQLKERLGLSDEQIKGIEKIYQESSEKMSEMRNQASGDRSQMREQMMQNRDELNSKIEEVLTADQIELYHEFQSEQEQFRRGRRGQRPE